LRFCFSAAAAAVVPVLGVPQARPEAEVVLVAVLAIAMQSFRQTICLQLKALRLGVVELLVLLKR
jgi:hypothetical protein